MSPKEQPCIYGQRNFDNIHRTVVLSTASSTNWCSFGDVEQASSDKVSDPRRAWQLDVWPNFNTWQRYLRALEVRARTKSEASENYFGNCQETGRRAFVNASREDIAIFLQPTWSNYDHPYYLGLRQYGCRPQVRGLNNWPVGWVAPRSSLTCLWIRIFGSHELVPKWYKEAVK